MSENRVDLEYWFNRIYKLEAHPRQIRSDVIMIVVTVGIRRANMDKVLVVAASAQGSSRGESGALRIQAALPLVNKVRSCSTAGGAGSSSSNCSVIHVL